MDFLKIEHETSQEFERIACELMNNYAIKTNDSEYRIIEIEFYWNSPNHKDASTYQRKYVDPKNGDWFFHYSGVDIALKNEANGGYGGILIRSIYSITEKKAFKGPMVCAMKLFSGTNAFTESIKTCIIKDTNTNINVVCSPRKGLGENAKQSGTDGFKYRFTIDKNELEKSLANLQTKANININH